MNNIKDWLVEPVEYTNAYSAFVKIFGDPTFDHKCSIKEWSKHLTEYGGAVGVPLSQTKESSKLKTLSLCSNFSLGVIRTIHHCPSNLIDISNFINSLIYQESDQEEARNLRDGNWRVWVFNEAALLYRYLGHTLELNWCWFF